MALSKYYFLTKKGNDLLFTVKYTQKATKTLYELDKRISEFIVAWIGKNLVNCPNPKQDGNALVSKQSGQWRYRIGEYRILAEISETEIIILAIEYKHYKPNKRDKRDA